MPPSQYISLVEKEIQQRHFEWGARHLDTIYFGGGTPSLISADLIVSVIDSLANVGLIKKPDAEITIEINPATLDVKKMEQYLKAGINRFSVGAQTFDDRLLKMVHREHNAEQTRQTLRFLKNYNVNFSFDILFALPTQTKGGLKRDLDEVLQFLPPHVSPYCLTVPEGHVLSKNRPMEDDQVEMFNMIHTALKSSGYDRYEISNYSRPGFESRHNNLYWDDQDYWGIGLSAHSYSRKNSWGRRFWNPNSIGGYEKMILQKNPYEFEDLKINQALTDFCHTSLRRARGLIVEEFENKFGRPVYEKIQPLLQQLAQSNWVTPKNNAWTLSDEGVLVSNQVFAALTFLEGEVAP